jgi:hypothetical protein
MHEVRAFAGVLLERHRKGVQKVARHIKVRAGILRLVQFRAGFTYPRLSYFSSRWTEEERRQV